MIRYTQGNLLSSSAQALVNTVNTVGVMGKGIALQFKENFPHNFRVYSSACKESELMPGRMLVVRDSNLTLGERIIINFPTKVHWRNKSEYSYIEDGLKALVEVIREYKITSIAIPPLGCGNGGLNWNVVKKMIEAYLSLLTDVDIEVYEPNIAYKQVLKEQYNDSKLTNARAMLLYALYFYEMSDERTNLVVANKLCYFLKLTGDKSFARMNFVRQNYGPYSHAVGYLLKNVNGKYIHGLEELDAKPFEMLSLEYSTKQEVVDYVHNMSSVQKSNLSAVLKLIDGFESAFAMEILATVAYIMNESPGINLQSVINEVGLWSDRKKRLFSEEVIALAYNRLLLCKWVTN